MSRKNTLRPLLTLAGAILVAAPMAASAQDYFREYGSSRSSAGIGPIWPNDYTYRDISPSQLQPNDTSVESTEERQKQLADHNFALGPVRFSLAASFGIEFNDNITFSEFNRESDIILRPGLNLEADVQINEFNSLRFAVAVEYAKYLDHSEFDTDGVLISPTSELEFKFTLGPIHFTTRDRFSYQEDPYDIPELSNVAKYDRYENQWGIVGQYDFNSSLTVSAGYDHYNLWTTEDAFSDQDRAIETFFVKPEWKFNDTLSAGLNATFSHITFSSDRPSGNSFLVGPFIDYKINQNTEAYLEVGFQSLQYDGSFKPTHLINNLDFSNDERRQIEDEASDDSGNDSFYVRFQIDQEINSVLRHRLSFSKTDEVGFFSDYYELYHVEYNAEFTGFNHFSVGPTVFYEYYDSSGNFAEKAHRVGATLGIRYFATNNLTIGLDYRYLWKDSNVYGGDYYQNLVFLSAYYKF